MVLEQTVLFFKAYLEKNAGIVLTYEEAKDFLLVMLNEEVRKDE